LRFYALPKLRMVDLTLTFIATEGEVTFGDTKRASSPSDCPTN